jgi:hypothetical protein
LARVAVATLQALSCWAMLAADDLSERPKRNWWRQQTSMTSGSKALYPALQIRATTASS